MNDDLRNALVQLKCRASGGWEPLHLLPGEAQALLDERDALWTLLNRWLCDGRFLTANVPEYNDLVERTRIVVAKTRKRNEEVWP